MNPEQLLQIYGFYLKQGLDQEAAAIMAQTQAMNDDHCDRGVITLAQGDHTVMVTTDTQPNKVYLWLDAGGEQVCQANINTAGALIVTNGFEIIAHILTNSCNVNYIVC
jgi:hypothetical protein